MHFHPPKDYPPHGVTKFFHPTSDIVQNLCPTSCILTGKSVYVTEGVGGQLPGCDHGEDFNDFRHNASLTIPLHSEAKIPKVFCFYPKQSFEL